ncbi:magnesium-translocating P-type ATPase [Corallococcus sp. H22C18031201]|uniref:magnesium-translocating P-type ATPase n=1 Tax=Citreicoccus inhibens TaxID=2849499 RepID=UPI000E730F95|nr:magnesium-translocating P-type ATPase [Citreicoccus inhibens]MBU8898100.1 magnesium-translocating P-type ATPase [Citreicoccus inhibens]RJS17988.1 magnesium-translocating P-type ATPase [Corallococcus sp. H22C18031201]
MKRRETRASTEGPPPWSGTEAALLARLGSAPEGLSESEAQARLERLGPNRAEPHRRSLAWDILARFGNPLVLVLLVASAVSAVVHDLTSSAIIATIVLMSVALDFVQEHRAGNAAERLRGRAALRARVLRDGEAREVPAWTLVPGDVVLMAAGTLVPADLRLLASRDLYVNQAMLTGEPYPVEKETGAGSREVPLTEARNAVFAGTAVISGTARGLVFATGARTTVGDIARGLDAPAASTAFARDMRAFGLMLMRLTVLLVLFVLLVSVTARRPLLESFLFAVALAVGLTPELLPMVVSVTLARGALRMASREVIVKRLSAVHDLGSMDVLCTDKTGTLTQALIHLERYEDASGARSDSVLRWAWLNSHFESGLRGPMDEAILAHTELAEDGWGKVDEVPFDFVRRRVSVLLERAGRRVLVVKGAPEDLLTRCVHLEESAGHVRQMDAGRRGALLARFGALGEEGYRVLAVAWRDTSSEVQRADVGDESGLVFAGFTSFLDPPKHGAREALAALTRAGVEVKVVTGDNERVATQVCRELELPVEGVLTGDEVSRLDEPGLSARAERTTVFARVSPAQKSRVVRALRQAGHVVGCMGDGINDAPSLRAADVGISVDSAVDVAREAADLLLLRQDLGVLHEGVLEGRRTFGNVMKYIRMGTSSNFGNMLSMAGASVLLPFLPMLPLQILLNNLLYDVSELAIPLDSVDDAQLARPTRWNLRHVRQFMALFGTLSSVFDAATFMLLLVVFRADAPLFQTSWFVESLTTQVLVIFIIRTRGVPWRSRPSGWLVASSLSAVGVALALPYLPLGRSFGFVPPPPQVLLALMGLVVLYLLAAAGLNRGFSRRWG